MNTVKKAITEYIVYSKTIQSYINKTKCTCIYPSLLLRDVFKLVHTVLRCLQRVIIVACMRCQVSQVEEQWLRLVMSGDYVNCSLCEQVSRVLTRSVPGHWVIKPHVKPFIVGKLNIIKRTIIWSEKIHKAFLVAHGGNRQVRRANH